MHSIPTQKSQFNSINGIAERVVILGSETSTSEDFSPEILRVVKDDRSVSNSMQFT